MMFARGYKASVLRLIFGVDLSSGLKYVWQDERERERENEREREREH